MKPSRAVAAERTGLPPVDPHPPTPLVTRGNTRPDREPRLLRTRSRCAVVARGGTDNVVKPRTPRCSTVRSPAAGTRAPPAEVGGFARRSALGFMAVVFGALVLALAVQIAAEPVLRLDRDVAGSLNTVVAPRPWLVTVLQVLTAPGAAVTAWIILSTLTVALRSGAGTASGCTWPSPGWARRY